MQSQEAYFYGSFVLPEGAGPGDDRLVFDAEHGCFLLYADGGRLVASIAFAADTDGTYTWIPGITSYSNDGAAINASLDFSGSLKFQGQFGNSPFVADGEVWCYNPGLATVNVGPALHLVAPETSASGQSQISIESRSQSGTTEGFVRVFNITDIANVFHTQFQGFIYAARWNSLGTVINRETWKTVSLPVGWTFTQPCQYRLTPDGFIRFRGIAQAPGAIVDGTVLTTLPVGYRPQQTCYAMIPYDSALGAARVIIRTTGAIELYDAGSVYPCLEPIAFSILGLL